MKRILSSLTAFALLIASPAFANDDDESATPQALRFTMKDIDGNDVELKTYLGDVVLVVNVASKCGLTPQYKQLQALHDEFHDEGLSILGFPCNQFLSQEPGSDKEIKNFCEENYGVEFDMFSKIDVNGKKRCDLYRHLTSLDVKPVGAKKAISWNFEKFLINRKGEVIARFSPRTKPNDEAILKLIKQELKKANDKEMDDQPAKDDKNG